MSKLPLTLLGGLVIIMIVYNSTLSTANSEVKYDRQDTVATNGCRYLVFWNGPNTDWEHSFTCDNPAHTIKVSSN
jgi:hypothetical protein